MKEDKVLAWLRRHDSTPLLFSDVSRALITNNKKQRARSHEARSELRSILADLEMDGVVSLTEREGREGRGLSIAMLGRDGGAP
ncbi:hypothetical protein [Nocardioides deserti]|uniref:Uncharacterized protein n=1 Tax=Nocardioides deserti TaxID=1588644 RepID=A0ABR6UA52_9ACTN|nr:hypothetical protein [Nocardioides deserti]MBC2961326.1 hypothetical protein [Nocardioides deserti]GGO72414.1 hypothetical protein GCM10012276_15720 [Nocardioides deserti]